MPRNKNRPDFKVEVKDGKLTLQARFKTLWRLWLLICLPVIFILIVLALLQPEGWLDILRAILLLLEPALMAAAGEHRQLH
jgi:hypothetical protein